MQKIPPALKPITPFVRRAEEIERAPDAKTQMIAYFCRSYAMEVGIPLNDNSEEVKGYLLQLMTRLEQDKKALPEYSQEEGKEFAENFALEIFKKADDEDRAGVANKNTARTFYAAGSFFEITKQFNPNKELDPVIKQSALYSKWRATEILRAIKEGRQPEPPPRKDDNENDTEENDDADETSGNNDDDDDMGIPSAPTNDIESSVPEAPAPMVLKPKVESPKPVVVRPSAPAPPKPVVVGTPVPVQSAVTNTKGLSSKQRREDALEYARFAVRAIELNEVELAMQRLKDALAVLDGK